MLSAKACRAPRQRSIKLHTNKVNVDRPLVQVFLVQESMRPDTLHTVSLLGWQCVSDNCFSASDTLFAAFLLVTVIVLFFVDD